MSGTARASRRRWVALVAASALAAGAACSSGGDDADTADDARSGTTSGADAGPADRSPEETATEYIEATIAGDCDRIRDLVTESFWTERGALSPDEAADDCQEDIDNALLDPEQTTLDEVELLGEDASEALVLVTGTDSGEGWSTEMVFVRDGDEWRLDFTVPR